MSTYHLPKIWQDNSQSQGAFSGLNQATSGSRFEQQLPKGNQPLQVYSLGTPNGIKVAIMLEELRELGITKASYDLFKINIMQGDQFGSDFVHINPNSKIPALYDQETDTRVFESASILLYLADKYHALIPQNFAERTEVLNWLFWQTGATPFLGGGFGHFFHYAPEKLEYPINRFAMEAKRQLDLLDKHLAQNEYIAGSDYSIADIAIWSWYGRLAQDKIWKDAGVFLDVTNYKHLQSWTQRINQRPAVQRALNLQYKSIT